MLTKISDDLFLDLSTVGYAGLEGSTFTVQFNDGKNELRIPKTDPDYEKVLVALTIWACNSESNFGETFNGE